MSQTHPALACTCTVAKSSDSSGLPCLGDRTNKCLLSLIYRQGLVGVSISNVTASLTEHPVRGDLSHSFGACQTSPETHHCSPWDPTRSARFGQVQRLIIAARGTAEAIEKITLFRSGIACPHLLTKDLFSATQPNQILSPRYWQPTPFAHRLVNLQDQ